MFTKIKKYKKTIKITIIKKNIHTLVLALCQGSFKSSLSLGQVVLFLFKKNICILLLSLLGTNMFLSMLQLTHPIIVMRLLTLVPALARLWLPMYCCEVERVAQLTINVPARKGLENIIMKNTAHLP